MACKSTRKGLCKVQFALISRVGAAFDETVRNFVCEAFIMTTRSMNATQDEGHFGGQGDDAAILG